MRLYTLQSSRESIAPSRFLKKLLSIIPWTPPPIFFMHKRELWRYSDEAFTHWRTLLKPRRMIEFGCGLAVTVLKIEVRPGRQSPRWSLSEMALDK